MRIATKKMTAAARPAARRPRPTERPITRALFVPSGGTVGHERTERRNQPARPRACEGRRETESETESKEISRREKQRGEREREREAP